MVQEQQKLKKVVDRRKEYRFHAAPGVGECKFENKDDSIVYEQYAREHNESEGFDIEHFVSGPVDGMVTLKPVPKSDRSLFVLCNKAVRNVLEYLDETNELHLELIGVIKANYRSSYLLFVSFEAKSKGSKKPKEKENEDYQDYQSVIYFGSEDGRTLLYLFRERAGEKLESGERVVNDQRKEYKFSAVPKKCKSNGKDDLVATYKKYAKEHNVSEGFDIKHFLSEPVDGVTILKPVPESDTALFEYCNKAVQNVLEHLEATYEHNLELVRVIRANYQSSHLFFVTFEAKAKVSGQTKQYQSVIYRSSIDGVTSLYLFRERIEEELKKVVDDRRKEYRFFKAPGIKECKFQNTDDLNAYERYAKEHNESEGFDIEHFVSESNAGTLMLKPVLDSDTCLSEDCNKAVQNVLEHLDAMHEQSLDLVRVIKANYRSSHLFFVTFEAKTKGLEQIKQYQSVIYRSSADGATSLYLFRERVEKEEPKSEEMALTVFEDQRKEYAFVEIDELERSDFTSEEDFVAYKKYADEYNGSEGFDIKNFISQRLGGPIVLIPFDESDAFRFKCCMEAVQDVLDFLDKTNERHLELPRFISGNFRSFLLFFVTFEARNKETEQMEEYQAVIFRRSISGETLTVLMMFRKKGEVEQKEDVPPVDDRRNEYEFDTITNFRKWDFETNHDFLRYQKYAKEYNASEGFDIKTFVNQERCRVPMLKLVPKSAPLFEFCKEGIEKVLEHLNATNEQNLELVKVMKAYYKFCYMFFVTFKAKSKVSGKTDEYQCVIFRYASNGVVDIFRFRKKEKQKGT